MLLTGIAPVTGGETRALKTAPAVIVATGDSEERERLRDILHFLFGETPVICFQQNAEILRYLGRQSDDVPAPRLVMLDLDTTINIGSVLDRLAASEQLRHVPVIAFGDTDDNLAYTLLAQGAAAVLPKPLSRRALLAFVRGGEDNLLSSRNNHGVTGHATGQNT